LLTAQQLLWDSSWCSSLVGASQQLSWEKQAGHPKGCTDHESGLVLDTGVEGSEWMEPPLLTPGSPKEEGWVAVSMELLHWIVESTEE